MINKRFKLKKRETGSALIIGLTILLLMLILGTAGMRTTIMEERMAGNTRDYNNAFQAGEVGLIDGEQDLRNKDPVTNQKLRLADYSKNDFATDCNIGNASTRLLDGLCLPSITVDKPRWLYIDDNTKFNWNAIASNTNTPLPYRIYGQCTTIGNASPPTSAQSCVSPSAVSSKPNVPPELPSVSRQPRYIIEYLGGLGSLVIGRNPTALTNYFRITTQGYGIATTDDTPPLPIARVMLQSIYGK